MRGDKVPLRDYTDRALADLARYHDATTGAIQAEIDRRLGEVQRETTFRLNAADAANATLLTRVERAEAALERQRGRMSAYAAIGSVLVVAVAVLTLILNHVRF